SSCLRSPASTTCPALLLTSCPYIHPPTCSSHTLSLHDALPISCDPRQQEPYDQYHENSHAKHWDYHKTPLIGRQPTDRKSGSAGMPRPISYAVFCLKKKKKNKKITRV